MSVRTSADEYFDQLNNNLKDIVTNAKLAKDNIDKMTDTDTWGGTDWTEDFVDISRSLYGKLNSIIFEIEDYIREWK
jgi:hypothetical protein